MSRQRDQLMGHAEENDGIEEYDNPLPDWWIGLFIFTVLFAIGYTVEYHFISDRSQAGAYQAQLDQAKELWPNAERTAMVSTDAKDIAEGEKLFVQNCGACHGMELEGGIGPNLKDKAWIHDGTPEGVIATITEGVGAKGMPAWGPILGPTKIGQVASYIVAQGGTLEPGEEPAAPPPPSLAVGEAGGAGAGASAPGPEGPDLPAFGPDEITPEMIEAGEQLYATNCASCHKPDMTGLVGPSLVDDDWLHGGELGDIYKTVSYGVPAKGMVPWQPMLGDDKVREVVSYIYAKSQTDGAAQ